MTNRRSLWAQTPFAIHSPTGRLQYPKAGRTAPSAPSSVVTIVRCARSLLFLIPALLALAGCASAPGIHSRGEPSARLSSARTFSLLPAAAAPHVAPAVAGAVVDAAQSGARDALRELGYSETSLPNADLVFYLHGKSLASVPVAAQGYQPAPSKFGMGPADEAASANHRFFVEAYDNHTKRQVWLGWLECNCRSINPERIQNEIQRILETFPARSRLYTRSG